ncbi:MAG: protein kinase [Polyangiales bacterium]
MEPAESKPRVEAREGAGERKKAVLLVAAESLALASGMVETVADVVRTRALKHYGEGLRQHVAIRLRSHALADEVLLALRDALTRWTSRDLLAAPGPRAHLYKLARDLCDERENQSAPPEALAWHPPDDPSPRYAAALGRLREELSPDDAELLELFHARELSHEELAHVLGRDAIAVQGALDRARAHATRMLGSAPPSRLGGVAGALQEAFALAPAAQAPPEELREALPKGTLIADRYQIQQRVGEGSFGDVYRAFDADVPGHVVALKLLHKPSPSEEARKTALRELRLIASVFHPSVVVFKDHGWYHDRLWFVMPWYEGETLEDRIKRAPLSRGEARRIFSTLAQALATMHAAGIRHQDVKPDNIFLARIGEVGRGEQQLLPVLLDLGVAAKEAEMIVAGTPLYFPPEIAAQYAGKPERPKVTAKADVFSLALSLRNALEPATQEKVPGTAIEAFIAHRAEQPPSGPSGREFRFLEPCFRRWLARDPTLRPSAEEFALELTALTRPERVRARRRSVMLWAMPIGLGSLLGLASITYVYLEQRDEARLARRRVEVTESALGKESAARARLEESYQHSELTRQQMSERLTARTQEAAELDAQLARANRAQADLHAKSIGLGHELDAARRDREQQQQKLEAQQSRISTLEGDIFAANQKHAFLESELREARSRSRAAESELDELRSRARSLLAELDRARDETAVQLQRTASLEQTVTTLRQEKLRLDLELETRKTQPPERERPVGGDPNADVDS